MKVYLLSNRARKPSLVWDSCPLVFMVEKSAAENVEWTERNFPFTPNSRPSSPARRTEVESCILSRKGVFFGKDQSRAGVFQSFLHPDMKVYSQSRQGDFHQEISLDLRPHKILWKSE